MKSAPAIANIAHTSLSDSTNDAPNNENVAERMIEPSATATRKVTKLIPAMVAPRWVTVIGPNG